MDSITLENFRCFRERQTARLAPLTLLVGENSTGKTSFLALIRAIWNLGYKLTIPDFKEEPYDLGSFDEIAHHHGAKGGRANEFQAGFSVKSTDDRSPATRYDFTFAKGGTVPVPVRRFVGQGNIWLDETIDASEGYFLRVGTPNGVRNYAIAVSRRAQFTLESNSFFPGYPLIPIELMAMGSRRSESLSDDQDDIRPPLSYDDLERVGGLARPAFDMAPPFASAPVRSKPRRTYDPARPTPDPEGDYIPMYLAELYTASKRRWAVLKRRLEDFGQAAGLFDEISIRQFGKSGSEPFQVQLRRFDGRRKGPQRNLIDVGYGISQVLPVITELLRPDAPSLFLLQQPEVHLHPSAQAALGSLFCQVASRDRQLIVETHSDHLLDRVRMEVRDGGTNLKPEDVSILYFERGDLDVNIHSIRIDEMGNILDAPDGYRRFFLEETTRSLWKTRSPAAN